MSACFVPLCSLVDIHLLLVYHISLFLTLHTFKLPAFPVLHYPIQTFTSNQPSYCIRSPPSLLLPDRLYRPFRRLRTARHALPRPRFASLRHPISWSLRASPPARYWLSIAPRLASLLQAHTPYAYTCFPFTHTLIHSPTHLLLLLLPPQSWRGIRTRPTASSPARRIRVSHKSLPRNPITKNSSLA